MSGIVDVSRQSPAKLTFWQRLYLPEILARHGRDAAPPRPEPDEHEGDADDPVPGAQARLLGALPRQAHPEDARGRLA